MYIQILGSRTRIDQLGDLAESMYTMIFGAGNKITEASELGIEAAPDSMI